MKSFSIKVNKKITDFNKTTYINGCKSSTIRFFFIASLAYGVSSARGILESEDVLTTIKILKKQLGVRILKKKDIYYVYSNGLNSYKTRNNLKFNCKNSGTLARLLPSVLLNYPQKFKIYGDFSLNKRDMKRVIQPLEKFGMSFYPKNKTTLPLTVQGTEFSMGGHTFLQNLPSAQQKTLMIFASLLAPGITTIKAKKSRSHTELMLSHFKAGIRVFKKKNFDIIKINGQKDFESAKVNIGGDMSSAIFIIALTILSKNSKIRIKNVNLNPTRSAILYVLKKMNAQIKILRRRKSSNEMCGEIIAKSSPNLKSFICPKSLNSNLIDDFVILFFIAARSRGVSYFSGLGELRQKESDRLDTSARILNQIGIKTKTTKDSIKIWGNPNLSLNKTYKIKSMYDHRIAMSSVIAGLVFGGTFIISDGHSINTSFPDFLKILKKLGAGASYEIKYKN